MNKKYECNLIYDLCDNILYDVSTIIFEDEKIHNKEEKLIEFLVSEELYNNVFYDYHVYDEKEKRFLKNYMMLFVVSSSYKLNCNNIYNDIDIDNSNEFISFIEDLNADKIIELFEEESNKYKEYLESVKDTNLDYDEEYDDSDEIGIVNIVDVVDDYFNYYDSNFVSQNDAIREIFQLGKIGKLIKINPFEYFCFLYYIDPNEITTSERIICDFININRQAIYNDFLDDESNIFENDPDQNHEEDNEDDFTYRYIEGRKVNLKNICDFVVNKTDDKFGKNYLGKKNFYGYIFGNVYESIKNNKGDLSISEELIDYFENPKTNIDTAIERFKTDIDFFYNIVTTFIEKNTLLQEETLYYRREAFKETDGIGTLKKFNSYYDEEEIIFKSHEEETKKK